MVFVYAPFVCPNTGTRYVWPRLTPHVARHNAFQPLEFRLFFYVNSMKFQRFDEGFHAFFDPEFKGLTA